MKKFIAIQDGIIVDQDNSIKELRERSKTKMIDEGGLHHFICF